MIQYSDRHWRYLMRLITRRTLLFTEMTMDKALVWNARDLSSFLGHNTVEYPLALQLGGNDPERLGEAVSLAEAYGNYQQINLNSGCPSCKAKKAGFGAELMLEPSLTRRIVHEMVRRSNHTEITVKCRLGVVPGRESWEELVEYIHAVRDGGVRHVIVHARTCLLKGLTPAQNRSIPPLRYNDVHELVNLFPEMTFTINGGIRSLDEARSHLGWCSSTSSSSNSSSGSNEDSGCVGGGNGASSWPYAVHGVMMGRCCSIKTSL